MVKVGVSNRHVHLTDEDFKILFGDIIVEKIKDLVQPGQFASNLLVSIKTEKNSLDNVRVIMPNRGYTQVELSKTDSFYLGINPPIRESGNLEGASEVTIVGPNGSIKKNCAIIANRHIHINKEDRNRLGLLDVDKVKIEVGNEKRALLYDVYLKESTDAVLECHLDLDDSNANFIKTGDFVEIIKN